MAFIYPKRLYVLAVCNKCNTPTNKTSCVVCNRGINTCKNCQDLLLTVIHMPIDREQLRLEYPYYKDPFTSHYDDWVDEEIRALEWHSNMNHYIRLIMIELG